MSRYTALISKTRRRAPSAFSASPNTLEHRETQRRITAEETGSLYLPSKAWLLEQARRQAKATQPKARPGSADAI